jgi:predicted nuclease of restriction endonuclease-like (RecB) superfamily
VKKKGTVKEPSLARKAATQTGSLLADVRRLVLETRQSVARGVNAALVALYWDIGTRIRRDILQEKRGEYGKEIVQSLSAQLTAEFGRGFGRRNLFNMVRFAEVFPDLDLVQSLIAQLGWTHFLHLLPLDDPLKRDFYAEMCRVERWSTRTLAAKIDGMLYERTALSKKSDELIRRELDALRMEDRLTPDLVFRDPYVLDFLGLEDTYSEKDLENAILREVESFLLELGVGFAFVARQKHISLDGDDYYLDLLFYHRSLRRLILIELKLGAFKPADSGQVELYLRWLDKHERQQGEGSPLAIILCAGKKRETVELLDLDRSGIHVAEYLTELPPRKQLARKLHEAVRLARARLTHDTGEPREESEPMETATGQAPSDCR